MVALRTISLPLSMVLSWEGGEAAPILSRPPPACLDLHQHPVITSYSIHYTKLYEFRIPLNRPSLLREVIEAGRLYFGACDDEVLREHLFAAIGAPQRPTVLLLPLRNRGKTVALAYGDFGALEAASLPTESLEIFASQAGLVLENAFYRKRLEKTSQ